MDPLEHRNVVLLSRSDTERERLALALLPLGLSVEPVATPVALAGILLRQNFNLLVLAGDPTPHWRAMLADVRTMQPWLPILWASPPFDAGADRSDFQRMGGRLVEGAVDPEATLPRFVEAVRKSLDLTQPPNPVPVCQVVGRMQSVCQIIQNTLHEEDMANLLDNLRGAIAGLIACSASALLRIEGEDTVLKLLLHESVAPSFVRGMQEQIAVRCALLAGRTLKTDAAAVFQEGRTTAPDGAAAPASFFVIPIISAGRMDAMLAFASSSADAYTGPENAFLCHLASHLSTTFPSFLKMQQMATRDGLTGLYNRSFFEKELKRVLSMSRRYGHPVGVLMIDVDNFKTLNDSYGHLIGDAVLTELAQLIISSARITDTIARYGGDEIAVILPNTDAGQSVTFAERCLAAIANHLFTEHRHPLHLSISVGVANSTHPSCQRESDLISLADRACYLAKENGKGRIATIDQVMAGTKAAPEEARATVRPAADDAEIGTRGRVLVVDDEAAICHLFKAMLTDKGFSVVSETNAHRAVDIVNSAAGGIDVILTDLRMPEMDGIQLLEAVQRISPDTVTIMVTGFSSIDNAIAAMRAGAYDFVRKPVDFNELEFVIRRGVERRRLRQQVESYRLHLENMLEERTKSLREAIAGIENSYVATIEALSAILTVRETSTALHNRRVSDYSSFLARRMGVPEPQIRSMQRGAMIHDIGKIGIPDAILRKPGPLTEEEWVLMRQHPVTGYQILSTIPFLMDEAEMVYTHHERFDGTGYPQMLAGAAIPLGARIFAVADAFDALRSDRVYRKAVSLDKAVEEIRKHTGTQFDPEVVRVLDSCYRDMDLLFER